MNLTITYDYRCPFTWNFHSHLFSYLKSQPIEVDFQPFFLDATHIEESADKFWQSATAFENSRALRLSLVVKEKANEKFNYFHRGVFELRFKNFKDVNNVDVLKELCSTLNIDQELVKIGEDGQYLDKLREIHENLVSKYEIFGVPSVILENKSVFVRLMNESNEDLRSEKLLSFIINALKDFPELNEFKHTKLFS
jgi:predicted DsbA family dithiol-disulfide isomerase